MSDLLQQPDNQQPQEEQEGKAPGLSFGACVLRGKVYREEGGGPLSYLYLLPAALAWLVLDLTLRFTYRGMGIVGVRYLPASLFTLGWVLILTGLLFLLPRKAKWLLRWLPFLVFGLLCLAHSAFTVVFRRFFSFAALTFAGVGDFVETDYIRFHPYVIAAVIAAGVLLFLSGRLQKAAPPKTGVNTVLPALALMVFGGAVVFGVHTTCFPVSEDASVVIWEQSEEEANDPADAISAVYHDYSEPTSALMVSGLYQYTVRDLWLLLYPPGALTDGQREQLDAYITDYETRQTDNEYTGLLAGKNVIMVQLEAIDTWMLSQDYMPNLHKLKEEGLSFSRHYTPAYITAGTFNTEFIANTGLLPATGGIPTTVYTDNAFPYALASLFNKAGYTARSFHGSEGTVYDRENIHRNLGYEDYYGGSDMAMEVIHMDRYLLNGFEAMTESDPFYSFIITYSGHGPYSDESLIYTENAEAAHEAAEREDGFYVYAVAGAMETDRFVKNLVDELEDSGLLEDTVLIFYADHYNYYMMNDALNMEIKGVDNINLLQHTDFFLWSRDLPAGQVEKVTSTADLLPTVANLFDLDTKGAFLVGHDGLGEQGGYVFFNDGSWYDGQTYWAAGTEGGDPQRSREISRLMTMSNWVLSGDYYGADDE